MVTHSKQLYNGRDKCICYHSMFHRSILGRADTYNRLSQKLIDMENIKDFQAELTNIVRKRCEAGHDAWKETFDPSRFERHHAELL